MCDRQETAPCGIAGTPGVPERLSECLSRGAILCCLSCGRVPSCENPCDYIKSGGATPHCAKCLCLPVAGDCDVCPHDPDTCPEDSHAHEGRCADGCWGVHLAHYLAMQAVMERLEFLPHGGGGENWRQCPECGGTPESGHREGCQVGTVLGRFAGRESPK